MAELSTLFVSHGAPDLPLSELPARRALEDLGRSLPRPDAIVIVSAHWEAPLVSVGEAEQHRTIYDFAGFDPQLRQFRYPAPGSPRHVELVRGCLSRAGYEPQVSHDRGLDHGAWVPLLLMFPAADIPVIPVSLLRGVSLAAQRQLGAALAPLRSQNILVIASGSPTHNLHALRPEGTVPERWALEFMAWLSRTVRSGNLNALENYRSLAPHAATAHPSEEHLAPLLIAWGAGGGGPNKILHESFSYGNLAMGVYGFGGGE